MSIFSGKQKNIVVLGVVFFAAWVGMSFLFYERSREYAISDAYEKIQNTLFMHRAIHSYIEEQQKPVIYSLKERGLLYKEFFSPEILSFTFIARNIKDHYNTERQKAKEEPIYFKLAAINPRNPINQADKTEAELIKKFNETNSTEHKEILEQGGKKFLYIALPVAPNKQSCMKCHSDPAIAPKELILRYGDKAGFYEKVGSVRAIISIRSPLSAALEDAKEVFIYLSIAAFFVFGSIYALIYYFFRKISKRDELLTAKTKELEELNKTLEDRVASEIDKRVQKEELLIQQSKMASMGEMIGAIAHQWKQPLNALSVMTSDVKFAYEDNELDEKYISDFTAKTGEQIRYMAKTIDDFKNFFKPDKTKSAFDPIAALNDSLALLFSQFKNNDIELTIAALPVGVVSVYGNKNELAQVILNIANNAKDALVTNVKQHRKINVFAGEEGDKIKISIEDNGGGISDELKEKIFEPYMTTKEHGTGIGLYMSRVIVEEGFGGRLYVEDGEHGAVFVVELERFSEN